jgi:quinolinate synthase
MWTLFTAPCFLSIKFDKFYLLTSGNSYKVYDEKLRYLPILFYTMKYGVVYNMTATQKLVDDIKKAASAKNALILAHNYQNPEIQDIADHVGDSLELSRIAADNSADIIVFCGVHFMAESAAMLSPQKKVLLPDINAGCPMADMADAETVREFKSKYPQAKVVTYINSSAAVKAESDVICTSSNAVKIVQRIDANEIIFLPDKNLGAWVSRFTDKKIHLWKGFCPIHAQITVKEINDVKAQYPDAMVMVHPECENEVIEIADKVFSTGEMVQYVKDAKEKCIIVGTESGMIHKLTKTAPHIKFIQASDRFLCPNMKKTTLEKVYSALINEKPHIIVDAAIAERAGKALTKMLELSR